jgi:hypothetical protein
LKAGIPTTWIVSPSADEVVHLNIFKPSSCPLTSTRLPYICWGISSRTWLAQPAVYRILGNYLEVARGVLGSVNVDDPAR